MSEFTIRIRKFLKNPLLQRKQFCVEVLHPGKVGPKKTELQQKLATTYKTLKEHVILFGFKTAFGGGRSTGFGLIYDDLTALRKFEQNYRLVRHGFDVSASKRQPQQMRRAKKDIKNRKKKVRGVAKSKVSQTGGKKK